MRFALLATLFALCLGVSAQTPTPINPDLFTRLYQAGGVGYAYAQNNCPGNVTDKGGYLWVKKYQFDIGDGYGGTITIRLLRRLTNNATNSGEIYMLFPGSASPSNFEADGYINQISYTFNGKCNDCMMHGGFMTAFLNSKDAIVNNARFFAASFPNDQFIIIGGSLGGSLAAIAWGEFVSNPDYNLKPTLGVTFGEPREGNYAWAAYMNQATNSASGFPQWLRVTHGKDTIPQLPPPQINGYSYLHFGVEVWTQDDPKNPVSFNRPDANTTVVCPLGGFGSENPNCINQAGQNLADHTTYPGYVGSETPTCDAVNN